MVLVLRSLHKLTHLRVVLQSEVLARSYRATLDSGEFLDTFCGPTFDFAGTAASLARAVPSLQYVFLTTRREDAIRTLGWRVAEHARGATNIQDEGPVLVQLHEEVMGTIVRREELLLSDEEVSTVFIFLRPPYF